MLTLYPPNTATPTIDAAYAPDALAFPRAGVALPDGRMRPYIYVNMVATVDGKATTGTKVAGIGSQTDRRAMRLLRAASDAVVNGAETVRRENFVPDVGDDLMAARQQRGQSAMPLGIVISQSGDLPLDKKFFTDGPTDRVVITTEKAGAAQLAEIDKVARLVVAPLTGEGEIDVTAAMVTLYTELGLRVVLLEGGPTINYAFIAHGLVDTLFMTIAPKIFGGSDNLTIVTGPGNGFPPATAPRLALDHIYAEENELFVRWRFV